MLSIRLSRTGKKKQPSYRVIVTEKSRDPWGKYLEILGVYNPRTNPRTIDFKNDRIKYWLEKGAQPSPTVHNLLVDAKIIEAEKVKATSPKKKEGGEEEKKEETKTTAPAQQEEKPAEAKKEEDEK